MANRTHLSRLKQGIDVWNAWVLKESLFAADLRGANLTSVDLDFANFEGADLSGAKLRESSLFGARLHGADLSRVDFTRARIGGANFDSTNLGRANFNEAVVSWTTFRNADLQNANFTELTLNEVVFSNTNLTNVVGLETCKHLGPSTIDHRTLGASGLLPLSFLRGVGLPDALIEYLPSLLNQAIQHYSCFISYSTKDQGFADRLYADLQNKGVRCWFAPDDLPIGGKILDEIDAAIRLRDKLLLILSEHSIESDWVEDEVTKAFEEERKRGQTVLFPIRLDDAVMETDEPWAAKLRARHIGDFRQWKSHDAYKKSFERVLRDLTVKKS